ncbi:uncharacterized protein LOC115077192 [Rhinatrema bivittatum]|uniref:uncharacterized protein LOC115077192 n=1 Tax=Rhinatrema bivittatum TaxID=194408 RepID=UPI00112E53A1|nr:uncharacterized protein LOC115077192 [Rhinatrema bivittatum]
MSTPLEIVCRSNPLFSKEIAKYSDEWCELSRKSSRVVWPRAGSLEAAVLLGLIKLLEETQEGPALTNHLQFFYLWRKTMAGQPSGQGARPPPSGDGGPGGAPRPRPASLQPGDGSEPAVLDKPDPPPPPPLGSVAPEPPVLTAQTAAWQRVSGALQTGYTSDPSACFPHAMQPKIVDGREEEAGPEWDPGEANHRHASPRGLGDPSPAVGQGSRETLLDRGVSSGARYQSPKEMVARGEQSYYFVNPWVDILAGWTEALGAELTPYPRWGSFEASHMSTARLCIAGGVACPQWDPKYMAEGLQVWEKYAKKRSGLSSEIFGGRQPGQSRSQMPEKYVPWTFTDLAPFIDKLPPLEKGASMWIGDFEHHTMGFTLCIGDIKALLSKLPGVDADAVFRKADMSSISLTSCENDGAAFNLFRTRIWAALRAMFPTQPDFVGLMARRWDPKDQSIYTFITSFQEEWTRQTDKRFDDPLMLPLFYLTLKNSLPAPVKKLLEDLIGMEVSPWAKMRAHITHYCNQYEEEQGRLESDLQLQSKEQRKRRCKNWTLNRDSDLGSELDSEPNPGDPDDFWRTMWNTGPATFQGAAVNWTDNVRGRGRARNFGPLPSNEPHTGRHRRSGITCWACGKIGHFAGECRKGRGCSDRPFAPPMGPPQYWDPAVQLRN